MIEELQRQLAVVQAAPTAALALAASAAAAAWWFAGRLHGAKIAGQEQHLATREERIKVAEDRVKLVEERVRDLRERQERADRLFAQLPSRVVRKLGADFVGSFKELGEASRKVEAAVIPATLRATEAPDTAAVRADVR